LFPLSKRNAQKRPLPFFKYTALQSVNISYIKQIKSRKKCLELKRDEKRDIMLANGYQRDICWQMKNTPESDFSE
jgi:hypothetical protein